MADSDADDLAALLARGRQQQDLQLRLDSPTPDLTPLLQSSNTHFIPDVRAVSPGRARGSARPSPPNSEESRPVASLARRSPRGSEQPQDVGCDPAGAKTTHNRTLGKEKQSAKQKGIQSQIAPVSAGVDPLPQVRRVASLPLPRSAPFTPVQDAAHPIVSPLSQDPSSDSSLPPDEVDERREQALAYLESIPLLFLRQLTRSVQVATARKQALLSKNKHKGKKATSDSQGQEGQESSSLDSRSSKKRGLDEDDDHTSKENLQKGRLGIDITLKNRGTGGEQVISVPEEPGSEPYGSAMHKFECLLRIASLLYEAILTDTTMTKRDIYYKDVGLFKTQAVVDKLVDDIVATAGLKRRDFHVCAAAKGLLISASLRVTLINGESLSISATNACLIPPGEKVDKLHRSVDWVLIVEKEAIFQTCCGLSLLGDPRLGHGVIITGKGYPDLATLQMLHLIGETYPNATFHCLVDADPHGLDILSVYTYGSRSSRYSADHAGLALRERVRWLGVKTTDWFAAGVHHDDLLELTERDVQKAMAMLRSDIPAKWKTELCRMLHLNRKAEIQIILTLPNTINTFPLFDDAQGDEVWGREGGTAAFKEYLVARMT